MNDDDECRVGSETLQKLLNTIEQEVGMGPNIAIFVFDREGGGTVVVSKIPTALLASWAGEWVSWRYLKMVGTMTAREYDA